MPKSHLLIIVIFTLAVVSPLLRPGFYTSADGENHLVRIARFARLLSQGVIYPRWDDALNHSQGYPVFNFTYPLPYYISSLFLFLGFSAVDSLKLVLGLSTLTSVFFFYLWTRHLPASLLFLFTPYRFVNLYVRSALGEIVFMGLLPAVFWLIDLRRFRALAVIIALLVLSHLQLSAVFLPLVLLYALSRRLLKSVLPSLLTGLLLSAVFWLPAIFLLRFTTHSSVRQFIPSQHLPTLSQLAYSPWGFGFSRPGLADDMSFQLGVASWLVLITAVVFIPRLPATGKIALVSVFLAILFLGLNPLGFWDWSATAFIQFPWRLLAVPMVFIPYLFSLIHPARIVSAAILLLALYANRNHIRVNAPQFTGTPDSYFANSQITTTSTPDEFKPTVPKSAFLSQPVIPTSIALSGVGLFFLAGLKSTHD